MNAPPVSKRHYLNAEGADRPLKSPIAASVLDGARRYRAPHIAVPDALKDEAGQPGGAMVMSIAADSPAAKAGLVAGDIVLSVNGTPAYRLRRVAAALADVGRSAELRVIRGGKLVSVQATIEARPA